MLTPQRRGPRRYQCVWDDHVHRAGAYHESSGILVPRSVPDPLDRIVHAALGLAELCCCGHKHYTVPCCGVDLQRHMLLVPQHRSQCLLGDAGRRIPQPPVSHAEMHGRRDLLGVHHPSSCPRRRPQSHNSVRAAPLA
jgi:hypothetical protein